MFPQKLRRGLAPAQLFHVRHVAANPRRIDNSATTNLPIFCPYMVNCIDTAAHTEWNAGTFQRLAYQSSAGGHPPKTEGSRLLTRSAPAALFFDSNPMVDGKKVSPKTKDLPSSQLPGALAAGDHIGIFPVGDRDIFYDQGGHFAPLKSIKQANIWGRRCFARQLSLLPFIS